MIKTLTVEQFIGEMKAQGAKDSAEACFVCPVCGTVQNAQDLIKAGAGKDYDEVEPYIGFSCVGRWTHHLPPPKVKGTQVGCNWTLGGLFQLHELVVVQDNEKYPRFAVATKEQFEAHQKSA